MKQTQQQNHNYKSRKRSFGNSNDKKNTIKLNSIQIREVSKLAIYCEWGLFSKGLWGVIIGIGVPNSVHQMRRASQLSSQNFGTKGTTYLNFSLAVG